jgi:hypothetical protein
LTILRSLPKTGRLFLSSPSSPRGGVLTRG